MTDTLNETGTATAEGGRSRLYGLLSWVFVGLGVIFFLAHYLGGRSLWLDEAMLALNIKYLSVGELNGKLDYNQLAPVGWLYLERAALTITGSLEYGLRLVGLLCGVGALVVFRNLAFKVLAPFGALVATMLLTFNAAMVRYSVEAKPYMVDVFLSVAAIAIAVHIIQSKRVGLVAPILFAITGVAAVLTSFSAVYVLAVAGMVVFLHLAFKKRWVSATCVAVMAASWLALFAFLLFKVYFPQLGGSDLTEGGSDAFFGRTSYAPLPPTSLGDIVWYVTWVEDILEFMFRREAIFPIAALIGFGAVWLALRRRLIFLVAFGPIAIGLIASSFQLYPMFERLALFILPGLVLVAGAGAAWLASLSRGVIVAPAALAGIVALGAGPFIAGNLIKVRPPFAQHEVAPAMEYLKEHISPGETVMVSNSAVPAWSIYRPVYGLEQTPWVEGSAPLVSWPCMLQDLLPVVRPGRHWVLYTSNFPEEPGPFMGEVGPLLAEYGMEAKFTLRASATQAWLYEVHLTADPMGVTPPVKHDPCRSDRHNNNFALPPRMRSRLSHG